MEMPDGTSDIVHPEVRAHINSLVSALGGTSADDDGRYKLGDDALEVLRDLKKWIRFYDEKTNRMDVARCIAGANLVEGDLLQILASWPENDTNNKFKARVALACFEIMVPLTWPMDRDAERMTVNHHRHIAVLELAQVGYKQAIINFDGAQILNTAVRTALPSMAIAIGDRTPRDQGIIKLVLFFLRNMAMITPPPGAKYEGDETQISRSTTIDAFSFQDIFAVLLMLASNMGEDFRTEDVIVMEVIYHLVKQVDIKKLFMDERQLSKAKAQELSSLMSKETAMRSAQNRKGPTRHNRFGTMIWMQRDDGKVSTITGQDALADSITRQKKLDESKTFKPPRRAKKGELESKDLGAPVKLNARANAQLRTFVEDFLDAGFNPLFEHVRKSLDREAPHVLSYHRRQFMYLVAWFLEAERVRRKSKREAKKPGTADEISSFNLVAGVLNQPMFVTLTKTMHDSWEQKEWPTLTASMRCFTQILLTVQEMTESGNEDDQDIAENTLSRLFYEDSTHDLIANVVRQYKEQGFEYLDSATELTHHFLRILEAYSKQNVDMQVRSRRRTRRKKKAAENTTGVETLDGDNDDSANDEANAERTSKERKFDFHRFTSRFTPQGVVDTFVAFTKYYRDLDDSQLKRAHRYFYRIAFKQDMSVMLFRVDIVHLLYNMIKGPEPLDRNSGMFKEWEELSKQILRKCMRKIEERPELVIELLFSKTNSTAFYLEYGHEKQTISTTNPRPAAELEFKHTEERNRQIAIVVGALLDKNQGDHIAWVKSMLQSVEDERRGWAAANEVIPSVERTELTAEDASADEKANLPPPFTVRPDGDARRNAVFKNSHLRLLMKLVGFERLAPTIEETPESLWILPSQVDAENLHESLDFINKAEFDPPVFEDGSAADDQLRRKKAVRKRAEYDDDDEGDIDDGPLFEPLGPTVRKAIDAPAPKTTKRRRRRKGSEEDEEQPNDSEVEEKARKRREREREKARKVKSEAYVHASDDDTDEEYDREFFLREEAQRLRMARVVEKVTLSAPTKRPAAVVLDESDDNDDDIVTLTRATQSTQASADADMDAGSEEEQNGDNRTPLTMSSPSSSQDQGTIKRRRLSPKEPSPEKGAEGQKAANADSENNEDDAPVPAGRVRQRTRGGFVMDSSDEE
ncbi:timeless protein [Colletotrichum higginsianum]|uniref:Topoisomerase 1-associated factor 1 n=2 Tax=Colletotrichum higginsianum TaxID=80884 RepID=H1UXY1_COLHI|nr:Timeless protein [Colletotrichum higginsianum IMI 349063]OBR12004.1 Timeless protein [Colletotrichum higginsianum IMI 349063]TIC99011.1 Topoisomerase 1-associated factor 1 [Colletotrichum higginsianum]CCF32832.1 timeless protein [Colletotrichum higginsianum]